MEPRGRGRGFGRARGRAGQQQQQQPQQPGPRQPPPTQHAPRGAPPGGAWGARPPMQAWPRPQMGGPSQPPPEQAAGRGSRQAEAEGAIPRTVQGQGEGAGNAGGPPRGAGSNVRGRVINKKEILYTRPPSAKETKQGTSGAPIRLLANFFPLLHQGKWSLMQYHVDMNPDIDHTGKRKFLVRTATRELFQGGYLFDGTALFTPQRLAEAVELFAQDEDVNVRITIRPIGTLEWGDGHYLQLFNIIVRKCLALMGLKLVGRNYYMPDGKINLNEHRVQLWPGYFTSMRQHERDILLNVDLQFKFMRTDNCLELFYECLANRTPDAKSDFGKKIIGSVVLTYYNNKTYSIDDVDFEKSPKDTFKMADGTEITYKDYYQKKYNTVIKAPDQPMLISRSKAREIRMGMPETVYLVPELCQLTGLTQQQRENLNLMKTLATYTRINVDKRIDKLLDFSRKIHSKPEVVEEIRRWDLQFGQKLVEFKGRVLPTETIYGGRESKYSAGQQADWTRDLRSRPMLNQVQMRCLAVLCPAKFMNAARDFVQLLKKASQGMSWPINNVRFLDIPDDRAGTFVEAVERAHAAVQPDLLMTVLAKNIPNTYNAIKKKCLVDKGLPNQVIVSRSLTSKGAMSIATKVAVQLNCKMGGAPWSVSIPLSGLMIVGYDVCRDTANKSKSFSAFVASMDRFLGRYFSMVSEHKMEEELSNNFATFMVTACQKFKEINGNFPDRIIIYRDGVGAGQLPYVVEQEVENIKAALKSRIYTSGELKMAFIIVSKRINTRIFTQEQENPPPGTVVDDVITLPERYDFYIVSQCVRQGTVSPTSYNVIDDTVGLPPDKMQLLTYKLTHLYYNWSGTVRVPAPCQYAHKLAFLVSQSMHRPAHPDLQTLLYYL